MAKKPQKSTKKKVATAKPVKKAQPEKPASPISQKPGDAMNRMLNAGQPASERPKANFDTPTRPSSGKPLGQPRQRGRRV